MAEYIQLSILDERLGAFWMSEDYFQLQDEFVKSMGKHMSIGVDAVIERGHLDYDFTLEWDARLQNLTPSERAHLLIDWARWHVLRAHTKASTIVISDKNSKALPLLQNTFRLPGSLLDGTHLKKQIEFTQEQAEEFIELAIVGAGQKGSHLHLSRSKRLVSALQKAIVQPNETLAAGIRNEVFGMRWAQPLLKKLCPFEAGSIEMEKYSFVEEQLIAESRNQFQQSLKRLPGMWLRVPADVDPFWGVLDHQFVPFFGEINSYLNAIEAAAQLGRNIDVYKKQLSSFQKIANENLLFLKSNKFEVRLLKEVCKSFPLYEEPRIRNYYWSCNDPINQKYYFDDEGNPQINLIISVEEKWLETFNKNCSRILAIEQKGGLSAKLIDILPGKKASAPTKTWLKKAEAKLGAQDLLEIIDKISGTMPANPKDMLHDPRMKMSEYNAADLKQLEFQAMVWAAHRAGEKAAVPLYNVALHNYNKVAGLGPRNEKLANAAAVSLSLIEGGYGVPYLLRLQRDTKYSKIKKLLDKCIATTSKEQGITKLAIEEQTVTNHGFV